MKKIAAILFIAFCLTANMYSADYPTASMSVSCYSLPHSDEQERIWKYYSKAVSIALNGSTSDTFAIKISYEVLDKNEDPLFDIEHKCYKRWC